MADALPSVVTPQWVQERLNTPEIRVLDATWYLPTWGKNAAADFKAERIPGSAFFDIDGVADLSIKLPHMVPTEAAFAAAMDALGISNDSTVIVYDRVGIFSAPRAWWTFKIFGHDRVAVMEGGLPAWKAAGFPVDAAAVSDDVVLASRQAAQQPAAASKYHAKLDSSKVRDLQAILRNIDSGAEMVLDARSAGRFKGTEPEPRAGLRGGRIPGSFNLPFTDLLAGGLAGGKLKNREELAAAFAGAGVDPAGPLVASCGSGLTACVLALAAYQVSGKVIPVYDGSWTEWALNPDTPVLV